MFDSNLTIYDQPAYPARPGNPIPFESVPHPLGIENTKKKRDEYLVEIRVQQRGKILNTRRAKNLDEAPQPKEVNLVGLESEQTAEENAVLKLHIDACLKKSYRMENFCDLVESINTDDRFKQHFGVIGIRKILSQGEEPPIQTVIDANLIPKLVQLMQKDNEPHLQMEAAWALTNIASGTSQQTQAVIEGGGLPGFIRLLKSSSALPILEQAVWALGNIAGDTIMCRDTILAHGGLPPLVKIVGIAKDSSNEALLQRATWALSNLIRGKPLAPFELVKGAIPILSKVIQDEDHYVVLGDACWAMAHLTEGNETQIDLVLNTGILPALGKHLENPSISILIPTLRILGNILTGDDEQTNMVLRVPRIVKKLFKLLNHEKKVVRRETCWVLSNITAGNSVQLGFVIDEQISLDHIIKLSLSDHLEIRKEACWTLLNATANGTPEQLIRLAQDGLVDCMCNLLNDDNADIVGIALEGIYNILNCGVVLAQQNGIDNPFLMLLDSKGGIKKIESLQTHPSFEVYRKATKILENHFEFEEVF